MIEFIATIWVIGMVLTVVSGIAGLFPKKPH